MSVAVLFSLLLGFQQNFPGKALSDAVQQELESQTGFPIQITPVRLAWDHIEIPEVAFFSPEWMTELPRTRLFVIEQIKLSYLPLLLGKPLQLHANIHEGEFLLSTNIRKPQSLKFSLKNLDLKRMPLSSVLPYAIPSGIFSFEGEIPKINMDMTQIQKGSFSGDLKNFQIKWKPQEEPLSGLKLPDLALSRVHLQARMGNIVEIDELKLEGDLQGTLDGKIRVSPKQIQNSQVLLHTKFQVAPKILAELGAMKLLLKGFQCGETLDMQISGTLSQLKTPKRGSCS